MFDNDAHQFKEAQARAKAREAHIAPFIIQPKTPLPEFMSYKCKCGQRVHDYTSYQSGAFYLFHCECGRVRRFTTLTHHCHFCGVKQQLNDGMMHDKCFWMCPKCANGSPYEDYMEELYKQEEARW